MKWQYETIKISVSEFSDEESNIKTNNFLNEFGSAGWELVSTIGIVSYSFGEYPWTKEIVLFFKRPIIE